MKERCQGTKEIILPAARGADLMRIEVLGLGALMGVLLLAAGCKPDQEPLVDVAVIDPTIVLEMRYAGSDNLAGRALYESDRCYLRVRVARRLVQVQRDLQGQGLGLKVWDAYRPMSVQQALWEAAPDRQYVCTPGALARHPRGAAVDVTLVDLHGRELEMPTGFDEASPAANRDSDQGSETARRNVLILEKAMRRAGFQPLALEWWHFDDPGWRWYRTLDIPVEGVQQYFSLSP